MKSRYIAYIVAGTMGGGLAFLAGAWNAVPAVGKLPTNGRNAWRLPELGQEVALPADFTHLRKRQIWGKEQVEAATGGSSSRYRLAGVVFENDARTALLVPEGGKMLRVRQGERLPTGEVVAEVRASSIVLKEQVTERPLTMFMPRKPEPRTSVKKRRKKT